MHAWEEAHGAVFEDVGNWKRAWYYPRSGETMHDAVNRECRTVRNAAGLFDASTLGKIEVVGPDAGEFMREAADEDEKPDVVFMDPPRAGSDRKFLDSLIKMSPKKVVYVSCNPETLARDLAYLTQNSPYKAQKIQPVDMFPHTAHIETVVLMSRK